MTIERKTTKQRIVYELRAAGVKTDAHNPLRSGIHYRGYLPHVKREGASYFVTFRLGDSLPQEVLRKWQLERNERIARLQTQTATAQCREPELRDVQEIERDHRRKIERYLDQGCGACWLKRTEVARLVKTALLYFEGQRYELNAWVVMPNHVHAVLWPMPNHLLSDILHSWKRFVAREANKLLNRVGQEFWQPESFDHWIRNDEEKARIVRYVINNPVTARLCNAPHEWKWSSAYVDEGTSKAG
jgi:REP element-mobilizing transposase RayT